MRSERCTLVLLSLRHDQEIKHIVLSLKTEPFGVLRGGGWAGGWRV